MEFIYQWIESHTALVVGWILLCAGWVASSYFGFRFAMRKYVREKAESVFEEVAVLIEQSHALMTDLQHSFSHNEPPEQREELWRKYSDLQLKFAGNQSRLQFLLNKYFGFKIATRVSFVLSAQFSDIIDKQSCEDAHQVIDDIVAYYETWTGSLSTNPTGEWDGYKWKMMAKCGMNVRPFIKQLQADQKK